MKNLSIKLRVTIWYTVVTVSIVIYILVLVVMMSYNTMGNIVEKNLMDAVRDNVQRIWLDDGDLNLSDIDILDNNVIINIYDFGGNVLKGNNMNGARLEPPGKYVSPTRINVNEHHYYVYDALCNINEHYAIVRGVVSIDIIVDTMRWAFLISSCILPAIILICVLIGYNIAKSAFAPVERISSTVSAINSGADLSRRIGSVGVQDEIGKLASTFDLMFDRLEEAFEREKQFTSNASHELRTPVSVIMSQCEYALSKPDDKEEMKESLDVVLNQSKKISNIISQLLMLARDEKGVLELEDFDLGELVEIVAEEMENIASDKNISIYKNIQKDVMIYADRTRMTRLFINLMSNAIKYGKENGCIRLTIYKTDDYAVGKIEDNGIGIKEENLDKIWNKFYQVDESRTVEREFSIGLGLHMVKNIIEIHNGNIGVKSRYGEGSCFEFKIPLRYDDKINK